MDLMWLSEYDKMYLAYLDGKISENDWRNFCYVCLEDLMRANKEILSALKAI